MIRHEHIGRMGGIALVALLWVAASTATAQQETPQLRFVIPGLDKTPAAAPTPYYTPVIPPGQAGGRWWNDPQISAALELTEAQRQEMDKTSESVMGSQPDTHKRQNAAREQYEAALRVRDWSGARKAASEWNQTLADTWGVQNTLKIELLMKLNDKQHQTLLADYPYLLQRPWGASSFGQRRRFHGGPSSTGMPPAPPAAP